MKSYEERLPMIDAAIEYYNGKFPYYTDTTEGYWFKSDGTLAKKSAGRLIDVCSHEEFNQRKAERQNKPKWSDAPEWAEWLAQDGDGQWAWYKNKPDLCPNGNTWWYVGDYYFQGLPYGKVIGNWQDTLEKRPEKTLEEIGINIEESRMNTDVWSDKPKEQDMNNDWYEKGELPPVGTMVASCFGDGEVVALPSDKESLFVCVMTDGTLSIEHVGVLRPISTETEFDKARADILDIIEANGNLSNGVLADTLAEQGYRKIKPMSEDEFVEAYLNCTSRMAVSIEVMRKIYKAGCRFIEAD